MLIGNVKHTLHEAYFYTKIRVIENLQKQKKKILEDK